MLRATETVLHLPRRRVLSTYELHAFAVGSIAAIILLIGWAGDVKVMRSIIPGWPTMKPITAASLMVLSIGALLSVRTSRNLNLLAAALGAAVAIAMLLLAVFPSDPQSIEEWARAPSFATMICLALAGGTIATASVGPPALHVVAGVVGIAFFTLPLVRIVALLLFFGPSSGASPFDTMALHTAVLLAWFTSACILLHPRLGFVAVIMENSLRGRVLRYAVPIMIAVPVAAEALSVVVVDLLGWSHEPLFAIAAALSVTIGVILIWQLSGLIAQWQRESNEQTSRLSRANEALERYASSAAHDLKAPARHVKIYGELLQAALAKGDLSAANKYAGSICSAADELPVIIDGMLDYSRSGFSQLSPADHRLSEIVQSATSLQDVDLKTAGAKVILTRDTTLWCDAQLMASVFQNLFSNSLKNRRRDRSLQIRIDVDSGERGVLISVADNGVGFDPAYAILAFNPLARGVKMAGDGAGIGLSTCRTIVHSHGGEIRIDPSYRAGARIELLVPTKVQVSAANTKLDAGAE